MMPRTALRSILLVAALFSAAPALPAAVSVAQSTPHALTLQLTEADPAQLYRITYQDPEHRFIWENLSPTDSGLVVLADDRHLLPEYRLQCESRTSRVDPVIFNELLKAPIVGRRRLPFGVPVSTFGGPGYLVPGPSDLKRDDFGNFWLYLDHPPHALLKYGPAFQYRFALLTPDRVIAHDLDADGDLYLLHPGNWVSKHGPLGEPLGAWEFATGRAPGEFMTASGLAIDRRGEFIYIADETLGRVQRFGLDLSLQPFPHTAWGWIGREDLGYTRAGQYDPETGYYLLDRPRQLRLDNAGHLYVSSEHYLSKFDLATGRQLPFGRNPVLGWGGTFTDSAFSQSAALDGHWQRQWLAGIDASGNLYVADRENEFLVNPRIQVFQPDGVLLTTYDLEDDLRDQSGQRVYVTAVAGLACGDRNLWIVDAAGRIYESPAATGLRPGGRLYLGPGAAGRQFDLTQVDIARLTVEAQAGRLRHHSEGLVLSLPAGERGLDNCERGGRPLLDDGQRSMWIPTRLGEPFRVTLFDAQGREIPAAGYIVELEETPGLFGTHYDYFRVTNRSGAAWQSVRFVAETIE